MSTLFHNVRLLDLTLTEGMTPALDCLIEDDRIAATGADLRSVAPPGSRVVQGHGRLLAPGLINGHFHSPVTHMKGRLDSLPLEIFMLYESPALEALRPTPREAYIRTLLACAEMLRGGTTAVQDDAFFVPEPSTEIIDAVMQAYADSGIRATVALDEPNLAELDKLPFLAELLPAGLREELAKPRAFGALDLLAMYRHLITRWHGAEGGRLRAAVSCSAPQRVSADYAGALADLSRSHGLPFYAHMLETRLQRVLGLVHPRLGGRSLVRLAADLGLLSERLNIIHAIWVDDDDIDLIGAAGCVVAHNPISNLRLGSGVMPFRRLRRRGIPICLGTDEAIADDTVDMWAVAKTTGLIHNITDADYEAWPSAGEVLDCLWHGGARAMGLQGELGAIAPGMLADLVLIDLDSLPFTPLNDLRRQLVYCASPGAVALTMVAGRIVSEGGALTTIDEPALRAEAREVFTARRPALERAVAAADGLLPFYRAMYSRSSAIDVGMHRRVPEDPPAARRSGRETA